MINLFSGHALRSPHARNEMSWNMGQRQNKWLALIVVT